MTIGKSPRRSAPGSSAPASETPERPAESNHTTDGPSVGRVLAKARLDAGLTVDQVSTRTRIRVPIVHAIESDDFDRCGGAFYARGHLRLLAREVGLDGELLVARYDAEHGGAAAVPQARQLLDTGPIKVKDHRRPNWTAAMVAAIVAVVALIGYNLVGGSSGGEQPGAASAPLPSGASAPVTGAPSAQPPAPEASVAAIAAAPADKVTVKLVAGPDKSWVTAKDGSGKSLFSNNLEAGQDQTFTDPKKITLVIGNAGAVHLFVNGKDLGPAGQDGQVVHLTYTPGDPQAG
ncbi:RodZ domain-containing protein [Streptomyces sp. TLI_171]|uniref:helix-turn-helix domain-containing protein n=1 Tax=Streptomyces sp. TLI_171 TaxID=1938859 RepID=UPI000C185150|nr:RodZ domain-containing protein [Streptomyces sp. TLI_171]RKE21471.1 cytoskeletal protein RodZ [Streptomyces sp. TLI_171]